MRGGALKWFEPSQKLNGSNKFKTFPNFDRSKKYISSLGKIKITYCFEGFEMTNNFLHRNLFRL
jgi:hypothetical protein